MKLLLLATFFCATTAALPAQSATPDTNGDSKSTLTPEQTDTIIKQLDALELMIGKNRGDTLSMALARCSKAVATGESGALQLYMDCYRLEHFERKNLKITDFQEWAKRNIDKHKDPDFLIGLWLQLEYLTLSIKAQDAKEKDMPTLVTSLQTFMNRIITTIQGATKHTARGAVADKSKGGKVEGFDSGKLLQMLRQSVKATEYARAFQLDLFLKKDDWSYDPIDFSGIYEKVIFPYYAEHKPAELSAQWDNRIKSELCIKAATMSESEYSAFLKDRHPEMVWKKAEYLIAHNSNTIQSIADMLRLIRENPTHPEAGKWAKRLREVVSNTQPPSPPSAAESQTGDATAAKTN